MDVKKYVGKVVKVELQNGFFFTGTVESANDEEIFLIDKFEKPVDIKVKFILLIREVDL